MGRQYGQQARDAIQRNLDVMGIDRGEGDTTFARRTRRTLDRYAPALIPEIEGLAEGAGVSPSAIFRLNQVDTFGDAPTLDGCTSVIVRHARGGPLIIKNNDGPIDGRGFVLRRSRPSSGLGLVQVTYAGCLSGLDAMNEAGLVNTHNSVGSTFDRQGDRLDIRLWAYALMRRCATAADFAGALADAPLTGKGYNILAIDAEGHAQRIEAPVPRLFARSCDEAVVFATNHFVSDAYANADRRSPEAKRVSLDRCAYLAERIGDDPPTDDVGLKRLMTEHEGEGPCRHGEIGGFHTLWSMIAAPQALRLEVAAGPPCQAAFDPVTVPRSAAIADQPV